MNPDATKNMTAKSRTLREAVAYSIEAAVIRAIADYTGFEARKLPREYPPSQNFELQWDYWSSNVDDVTKPHARSWVLLWIAIYTDSNLAHLKEELVASRILKPESLFELADYLIEKNGVQATHYVDELVTLENLTEARDFIRSSVVARNTTRNWNQSLLRWEIRPVYVP